MNSEESFIFNWYHRVEFHLPCSLVSLFFNLAIAFFLFSAFRFDCFCKVTLQLCDLLIDTRIEIDESSEMLAEIEIVT